MCSYELLESEEKRKKYLGEVKKREMIISAFSCHYEPLHPNQALAKESDEIFIKSVLLAEKLNIPVVNVLSSAPAGAPGDKSPNWVTCPWPPHYLDILDYQWNKIAIPYWKKTSKFDEDHGVKIGVEMYLGMLIYNVETMLQMREACGPAMGCNFDPSHLFWNGVNPVAAIKMLGIAIVHVHGKDCYVDNSNIDVNGCNDQKDYGDIINRSWTFRSIGYGHSIKVWKDITSALRLIGYDYVISIKHEDALMSFDEGLRRGFDLLNQAVLYEKPGEMFWA